eukprot:TRINITY_DN14448_c0_g1_i1.p1 TRINITY_DN14448_c0_g1~~TRINITY_DN14448_c0_g1_i1.p1  ORF type:complete len:133 (+),score=3.28 TRINITY_DN14448_c0_g1_i1:33-431(+)
MSGSQPPRPFCCQQFAERRLLRAKSKRNETFLIVMRLRPLKHRRVICPLCGEGRLHRHETGELRCTQCADMRATTMDEALPLEDVLELMGAAEQQHWQSGCSARACFKVKHDYGPPMLFLCCDTCAWNQIAL